MSPGLQTSRDPTAPLPAQGRGGRFGGSLERQAGGAGGKGGFLPRFRRAAHAPSSAPKDSSVPTKPVGLLRTLRHVQASESRSGGGTIQPTRCLATAQHNPAELFPPAMGLILPEAASGVPSCHH